MSVILLFSIFLVGIFGSKIVHPIPESYQSLIKEHNTWRPGCPVPLSDLSLIDEITFMDFEGKVHNDGQIVIHKLRAEEIQQYMSELFTRKFPIRSLKPMWNYNGNDTLSMNDDNSSGFNCRYIGGTTRWSYHAYGCAFDLNTMENPFYNPTKHEIEPKKGAVFLNRTDVRPGMIVLDDFVYKMFHTNNWTWGGNWERKPMYWDWQHFQKPLN